MTPLTVRDCRSAIQTTSRWSSSPLLGSRRAQRRRTDPAIGGIRGGDERRAGLGIRQTTALQPQYEHRGSRRPSHRSAAEHLVQRTSADHLGRTLLACLSVGTLVAFFSLASGPSAWPRIADLTRRARPSMLPRSAGGSGSEPATWCGKPDNRRKGSGNIRGVCERDQVLLLATGRFSLLCFQGTAHIG